MATVRNLGLFPSGICGGPDVPALYENRLQIRGDGSYATFILTAAQATALCWRIKKWKYEFEIEQEGFYWSSAFTEWVNPRPYSIIGQSQGTCTIQGADPQPPSHITWAKVFDPKLYSASSEKDLIQYYDYFTLFGNKYRLPLGGIHDYTVEAVMPSSSAPFQIQQSTPVNINIRRIPQNNFDGTFTSSISIGWTVFPIAFPSRFNVGEVQDLSGTFSFLGNSFSFPAQSGDFGSVDTSYPTADPATSGQRFYNYQRTNKFIFDIEPAEYWPYDPQDGGGPIYDTDTGQQLRPFPD